MPRVVVSRLATALLTCMCFGVRAFGQGCVSCYTTAAAGGQQTAHALRNGILVLLFPPVAIFAGIILTLHRWRASESRCQAHMPADMQNVEKS